MMAISCTEQLATSTLYESTLAQNIYGTLIFFLVAE